MSLKGLYEVGGVYPLFVWLMGTGGRGWRELWRLTIHGYGGYSAVRGPPLFTSYPTLLGQLPEEDGICTYCMYVERDEA